ncbi:EvpB family type VI secretion protein [Pacificitalea manganoxidans]|uniref:EvpB family type VI secretion protein n=1 Tax=Pacificitalea manganoxidans TaxID=1411902 RepID=A0A291LXZ0_9RHOB|nr:type VI secretion system contractile sheath large subunit [Pacificitalea manganoxidans]ATI41315.1 EvpB family type VI secretion protein [Pacificitalea manganoxidans]MDR6308713.1 type VI secretion system protein ImpC [Pacificitalea manganoxidans]
MSTEAQQEAPAAGGAVSELDDFSALLKQNFKPRSDSAATEVENAVQTLVKEALADQNVIKEDIIDTVDEMIAKLDQKLTAQVNEILHHEEYQKVESAWRGLHYCVMNSEPDASMKIKVLNVSKKELERELRSYPGAKWDQSPLFKRIYEAEFGQLGGQPYGALVGDFYFDHSPADVRLLRDLGKIAAASHAPFISSASAGLLGMDSWNELNNPTDLASIFETPEYAAWKSLRESENSRYVALTAPRVLAREPYGQDSLPVEAFNFEEETDGHTGEKYAWMNAAYTMAANIARAHKDYGWTVRIRGVQAGGEVINLPTHTFKTDDGAVDMKCPTEIAITDRREAEMSKIGMIGLVHRKNSDKAAFIGAQSLYKPKSYVDPQATASDNLSSRLPYIFAVSRFSHYLKCMVRDQIGMTREKEQLQRSLQTWIAQYIDGDPKNSSEETKARRPLAGAEIMVVEDEENPGYYMGKFFLRPHFQMEGMDIGMSLVSRLPSGT